MPFFEILCAFLISRFRSNDIFTLHLLRLLELLPDVRWGRGREVLSRRELIAALGLHQSARRNFRDNYLKPATAKGLVKMQFPEVPSRPEQAYKLTAKGLELFSKLKEVAEE